ncbi:hypothetical protein LIER_32108 [Lithospermum erythrorhizon]|uniref:Retrotransposon Copia-like N-terminal domain-containing protein n=1 Tax=Lithospermum erythrorhizon TaxID=34254 RepID=A0AAV3RWE6_LITER
MVVCGRGKLGYLTSEAVEPPLTDPKYALWKAENVMVMSWLHNSMDEDTSSNYLYFTTAKEIWNDSKIMYSDLENASQDLTCLRIPFPTTEEAFSEIRREETRKRVMLQKTTRTGVEKSALMTTTPDTEEPYAALAANRHRGGSDFRESSDGRSKKPWCDHFHKPGHTKADCWEIHGKPANWSPRR